MIGTNPFAAYGPRSFQPVRPVNPVVRSGSGVAAPAKEAATANADTYTPSATKPHADAQVYSRKGILQTKVARQNTYDLTIQTAEGDIATLHLAQSDGFTSTTTATASDQSSFRNLDVQMSIQGDLNPEESKAINTLIQEVNGVAEKFFAGDMQAASTKADSVNLQGSALSAFAMDLHSQEMRRASAIYEQVASLVDTTPAEPQTPLTSADVLSSLKQLFANLAGSAKDLLKAPDAAQTTTAT